MPGEQPVVILTDGFCEGEGEGVAAGFGAILLDLTRSKAEWFGAWVPAPLIKLLRKLVCADQLVGQAELIPAWAARVCWADHLKNRRVVQFIDNDAARHGLIRGHSPSVASAALLAAVWKVEAELNCLSWFDRVASKSNLADGPSRLDFPGPVKIGGHLLTRVACPSVQPLITILSEWA